MLYPHVSSHFAAACLADRVAAAAILSGAGTPTGPGAAAARAQERHQPRHRWTSWQSAATASRSPDLKPEEVSLKLGGRARPLTAINLIDVAASAQPPAVSPLPPPFGTNVQTRESRDFVLVVDDDSFRVGTERPLREAADTFLDKLAPDRSHRARDDAVRGHPGGPHHRAGGRPCLARGDRRPGARQGDPG